MKLINFKASNFIGDCIIDAEIEPEFIKMNEIAIKHGMTVIITSSLRKDTKVAGAIVTPAKMSNHLIGHAIDCNVKSNKTGEYFNSKKMGDGTGVDELFLQDVDRNTNLRWGQAFNNPDSVHFDTALNIKAPALWLKKYNELKN